MAIEFTCPYCGRRTNVAEQYAGQTGPCGQCGQTITIPGPAGAPSTMRQPPVGHDIGDDPAMRMLLPVGRSPWAIIAGYAGLLSLIPIFAPLAIIFGVIAIVDIRRHPHKHGMGRAIFGLVMGILVVGAFVAMFVIAAADGFK